MLFCVLKWPRLGIECNQPESSVEEILCVYYAEIEARRIRALDAAVPGWRQREEAGHEDAVRLRIREAGKVAIVYAVVPEERQSLMVALRKEFPGIVIMFEPALDAAEPSP